MNDVEIIRLLGGVTEVARLLGIKPPSVHAWQTSGIPEPRLIELAAHIEAKSGGKFSRRERWPERFCFIWPELGATPAANDAHTAQAAEQGVANA
jgi:DNA-binding transcriptional regulator YdaS (Cro superfamily)